MTRGGYLSIPKDYMHSIKSGTITINNVVYDIKLLSERITYTDNADWYRWNRRDYTRAVVQDTE